MKRAMFAVVLLTVGCFSLPILAQQQDLQEVMNAANALSARESELLGKKDAAGIASLFTSDALLVTLAPQFAFKPGRDGYTEALSRHHRRWCYRHHPRTQEPGATWQRWRMGSGNLFGHRQRQDHPGQLV